jgi:hypothetical protein
MQFSLHAASPEIFGYTLINAAKGPAYLAPVILKNVYGYDFLHIPI